MRWRLNQSAERLQEARSRRAIDRLMVKCETEHHDVARHDLVANDRGLASDAAQTQNRTFRVIDDGGEGVDAQPSQIRDGERAAAKLGGGKFFRTGALDGVA